MSNFFKTGCLAFLFLIGIGIVFVLGIGVGAIGSAATDSDRSELHKIVIAGAGEAEIAQLTLDGIIVSSPSQNPFALAEGLIIPDEVGKTLRMASADDTIKALIVRINSPGGSAVASDEIYQHIKTISSRKPVVIVLGDTAASGGYYIASAGSFMMANPASLVGSIGVIAEVTDLQELLQKIGVEQETYKSGEFKDLFSMSRDRTLEEKQMIQELLDSTYQTFISRVATGRGLEESKVRDLAQGKVYSGQKALEVGLVDALVYNWDDAFKKAKELAKLDEATLVDITTKSTLELLFSSVSSQNPLSAILPHLWLNQSSALYLYK